MRKIGFVIVALGLLLHAYIAFFKAEGGAPSFTLQLLAWSSLPYIVVLVLFWQMRWPIIPLSGVVPVLVMDALNYYAVFIRPESSTAALGLFWMPLWNLVIFMPAGLMVGWIIYKVSRYTKTKS